MSSRSITTLLLVEDNCGDARMLREMFKEHGLDNIELAHVECMSDAEKHLAERPVDMILLDLGLPDAQGLGAVRRAHAAAPRVPLVVLTGLDDESMALQALREGAQDYLIKGQIERRGLMRAVRYAIERKRMEEQLRHSQKMEVVGQLAAGVAHEFNNLLQALMSLSAIVRLRAGTAEVARIGTEMEVQIKRGASLTQQLLLFSQRHGIEKSDLDLREQVEKASVLLRRLIPESIRIVVESSPERLSIEGDAGQMQQVLLNLAINARDSMPAGGTLTLRAGSCRPEVFLEVEDTGHGVDEATRPHIFEPFFTTKDLGRGTGLGLAVVHGIVEQHRGRIEVRSRSDGSIFRVILPAASRDRLPIPEPAHDAALPMGSGRVLLVEDEEGVRAGIAVLLEMIGYAVTAVASGEEALATPLEPAPDLMLSDVTLPGIAGEALAELLRRRWPSLKVLLMSGHIEEALRVNARARGWQFLQKPFEMTQLANHLRAALDETPEMLSIRNRSGMPAIYDLSARITAPAVCS